MNEQNIIDFLIGGILVSGFIGCWIGCYLFSDNGEREMKQRRKDADRGRTNYARMQAYLVTSSRVIKKG